MKLVIVACFAVIVYIANAVPVLQQPENFGYPRFLKLEDEIGNAIDIDLEAEPDMELVARVTKDASANNAYLLFTRRNPIRAQDLILNNVNSISSSNFNPRVPTAIIVHGWLSDQYHGINPTLREAFLRKSDVNVIVVDWNEVAQSDYVTAVSLVPVLGRGLGRFIKYLNSVTGVPYTSIHLMGYSLGAHIVGNAGKETEGKLARITGLDPAGPLWHTNSNRLQPTDAVYVEAIHTDGGYSIGSLGIGYAIAQADFFPNGGVSQPGCNDNLCNHERSWQFFAATITYNHLVGRKCNNALQITMNLCRGETLNMGNDDLLKTGSGMYRLNTQIDYPY